MCRYPDNFLWSIVEDQHGNIWTASANGATRLNWKDGKSTHFFYTAEEEFEGARNQVARIFPMEQQIVVSFTSSNAYVLEADAFIDSTAVVLPEEFLIDYDQLEIPRRSLFNSVISDTKRYYLFLRWNSW